MISSFITSITLTFIITFAVASLILSSGMVWNVVAITAGNVNVSVEGWVDGISNREEVVATYSSVINNKSSLDWQIGDMHFANGRKPITISVSFHNQKNKNLSIIIIKPVHNDNLRNEFYVDNDLMDWDKEFIIEKDEVITFMVAFYVINTSVSISKADVGFTVYLE